MRPAIRRLDDNMIKTLKIYLSGFKTLSKWIKSGGECVPREVAQSRADICTGRLSGDKCPQNIEVSKIRNGISGFIRNLVERKIGTRHIIRRCWELKTCSGCGCPLRTKILVPLDKLQLDESVLRQFDDRCWMRKEFNQTKI